MSSFSVLLFIFVCTWTIALKPAYIETVIKDNVNWSQQLCQQPGTRIGNQHLIQLIVDDDFMCAWVDENSSSVIEDIIRSRGVTGLPGPGFTDRTWTTVFNSSVKLIKNASHLKKISYPDNPQHPTLVKALFLFASEGGLFNVDAALSTFHNRYYTSDTGVEASKWIMNHAQYIIDKSGRKDVTVKLFSNVGFPQSNIIARIEGSGIVDDVVIIGAHMDSINSQGPQEDWISARAPGADDDGSGSSVVMEAFRVLVEHGFVPERSLEFHWYAGEERGLLGSQQVAEAYVSAKKTVYAMLEIDMCGGGGGFKFITDFTNQELTSFEEKLVDEYCVNSWREDECGYACSDHASWHENGYPASFPIEVFGTTDPLTGKPCVGHTDDDRLACISLEDMFDYLRLGIAYLVELSFSV